MKTNTNYLESIYDLLNSNVEEKEENDFNIIDDDYDYNDDGYEAEWGEEVEIVEDDNEDEDFMYDLGDGYIPLPKGDDFEVEVIVIDENYIPDEYEQDVCGTYERNDDVVEVIDDENQKELNDIKEMLDGESSSIDVKQYQTVESEFDNLLNADDCSVIKLPKEETLAESLNLVDVSNEDKRIALSIAREHMEKCEAESQLRMLPGGEVGDDDVVEAKWIGEDMFGNNIEAIIAESPDEEKIIEDDDFVEGSFEEWAAQQGIAIN